MALYEILADGTPRKVAGNLKPLVAESVALNTTRTGQNDTVVEYYISDTGKTWYRKWASGWKECGGQITGSNGWRTITMPISFTNLSSVVLTTQALNNSEGQSVTSGLVTNLQEKSFRFSGCYQWGNDKGYAGENFKYYCCGF